MKNGENIARNCDGKSNTNFRHVSKFGLVSLNKCPKAWLANDADEAFLAHSDYIMSKRFNTMPNAGGLLDQDSRYLETIGIIDAESARVRDLIEATNGA